MAKIFPLKAQGNIDQADHHRHFNEGTDNRGKSLAGVNTEYRHSHRDSQFEVVAGGGESERRALAVIDPE